ncbi:MAG: uroporphyrinogen-III synthase [Actinomycetota bacterium]
MAEPVRLPLAGLTVVVTRPLDQAGALAAMLEEAGATAIVMPLIELVDVVDSTQIEEAVTDLGVADWVVVASAQAARRVGAALERSPAQVAAVGAATAAALPRADLVAERQSAEGLVAQFPAGTGRAVVVQAADGAPTLVHGLAQLGWHVRRLDSHRSVAVVPTAGQQLAVLKADAVVFTSGSQAEAWVRVFGEAAPPLVVTIGPQTTRKVEQCGLKVAATAADHSLPGVLRALELLTVT